MPGGVVDIVADDVPDIALAPELCKRCGICAAVCPMDVFASGRDGLPEIVRPRLCIWCSRCERCCPDYAIRLRGRRGW